MSVSVLASSTRGFEPEGSGRCLNVTRLIRQAPGSVGLTSMAMTPAVGTISWSSSSRFGGSSDVHLGHAGDVAARSAQTGDEAEPHRIAARCEDDGNGCWSPPLPRQRPAYGRDNHGDLTANQIGRHRGQPLDWPGGPAIFDRDVLTLDKTGVLQRSTNAAVNCGAAVGRPHG